MTVTSMTAKARLTITPPSDTSFAMPIAMLVGSDTTSICRCDEENNMCGPGRQACVHVNTKGKSRSAKMKPK